MTLPATSKWIGTSTISGHVERAMDFQTHTDIWMSMGKPTAWFSSSDSSISDSNPPLPDATSLVLDEPVAISKASLQLVIPCTAGTAGSISVYGQSWLPINANTALTNLCRWVLVQSNFSYNEVPIGSYDSFTTGDVAINSLTLPLGKAGGYQIGDSVQLGYQGQLTTVSAVDTVNNILTVANPLTAIVPMGTFITVTSTASPFQFRQMGIIGNVAAAGAAGQTVKPASFMSTYSLQYLYNTSPIPRSLGREDTPKIVLTF